MRKRILRAFQKEDVQFIRESGYRVLIANAPGTGKTVECLAAIAGDRKRLSPVVVVCPASVVTHWRREARKWCPGAKVCTVTDMSTPLPRRRASIYIISWSLLSQRYMELLGKRPSLLIADECHFAKSPDALRSQSLWALAKRTPHLLLLTGTPLINRRSELVTLQRMFGSADPPMIRRLLEDVATDIPPKTRSTLHISLRPKDAARYRRAESDFAAWLEAELNKRLSAGEAEATAHRALAAESLVKVGYLRRILGESKVHAAADWAGRAVRLGEPVVLFCEHREVVRRIQVLLRRQRIGFVTVEGATPRAARQRAIDSFQAGKVPVFIGSKAAKEGITLHRARHLLFVERYFTSAEEEQAEDRIRRIGQKNPTTIWFLHALGTIDDRLSRIIESKRRLIRDAIGSADIVESEASTVVDLISAWSEHIELPTGEVTELGLGPSLDPLPSPTDVCSLLFDGSRWTVKSARAWARMNGYHAGKTHSAGGMVKVSNHNPAHFHSGSFSPVRLSSDIQAVMGKRKPRRSTRSSPKKRRGKRSMIG